MARSGVYQLQIGGRTGTQVHCVVAGRVIDIQVKESGRVKGPGVVAGSRQSVRASQLGQGPVPIYTHQVVGRLVIAIEIVVQGTVPNGVYIVGWVYRPAQHRLPRDQIDVVPVGGPPYKLNHPAGAGQRRAQGVVSEALSGDLRIGFHLSGSHGNIRFARSIGVKIARRLWKS